MARSLENMVHSQDLDATVHLGRQGMTSAPDIRHYMLTIIQLFLRFEGPTTMLLQSRASRISDVLTLKDVNEIAESQPGAVQDAVDRKIQEEIKQIGAGTTAPGAQESSVGTVKYATVRSGKAVFEGPKTSTS